MASSVKASDTAKDLARNIQEWSEIFGHNDDAYLQALQADLAAEKNLDYWAAVDPIEYLPNYDGATKVSELLYARVAAGIRNVVIFFPVAITWAGVAEATTRFNEFVKSNSGTPANFLQFWQDGYGLLDDFWKIGSIASLDFFLVALVIVLSSFVAVIQSRGQRKASKLSAEFSRERRLLGLKIRMFLFAHRTVTAASVPNDVQKSVTALRTALREMQGSIDSLKKSTTTFAESVPSIANQSAQTEKTLTALNSNLQKQLEEFGNAINKSSTVISESLKVVLKQTSETVSKILSDVDNTSTSMKSSARAVQDQIQALQRDINRRN